MSVRHLLHGLLLLLEQVAVMPQLVHDGSVQVHLISQPQTSVLQLLCHSLLLLQNTEGGLVGNQKIFEADKKKAEKPH